MVSKCQTPCSFNNLSPAQYSLEVLKEGYQSVQTALQVKQGDVQDQKLKLESLAKGIYISSKPSGADVFIWARDTDGDSHRADQLRRASTFAEPSTMQIAGGVADPCLESWMVAIARAHADPDSLTVSKLAKIASENEIDSEEQMVELVKARGQEGNFGSPSLRAAHSCRTR